MPEARRLKFIAALFGIGMALVAISFYLVDLSALDNLTYFYDLSPPGGDYITFWSAARMSWFDPEGAYRGDAMTAMLSTIIDIKWYMRASPLYYPPTYMLLISPFGLFDYFTSLLLFFACGTALFLTTMWVITRQMWFVLLMLAFGGIWINLVTGQNGLFTSSLFGLGFALLPGSPIVAGICFGLLTFKPHLGLLIPVALVAVKAWRTIAVAALVALALFVVAGVVYGPDIWVWGTSGMFTASFNLSRAEKLWGRIPSAFSLMRLTGLTPGAAMMAQAGLALSLAAVVWQVWRRNVSYNMKVVVSSTAALLAIPFLYDYDMALLGVAIAFYAREIQAKGWWWVERFVLPMAILWPILIAKIMLYGGAQVGFLAPVFLLVLALRRIVKEVAVAPAAPPLLNRAV